MTTREVTVFLSELGQLRQELGAVLARLDAFAPKFEALAELCDRTTALERSVEICQSTCGRERTSRGKIWHWLAYVVAGLVPGAATWYLTRGVENP